MSKFPENSHFRTSKKFTERIKFIMDDNDCASAKQFAELAGVSEPVISKALNFGIVPSLRTLIKIADKLELPLLYLCGLSEEKEFVPSPSPATFAERLTSLTENYGLNFGQLANKMEFPRTYIYEWIKEKTLPSPEYAISIADCFEVSPDYLLGRTDYKN